MSGIRFVCLQNKIHRKFINLFYTPIVNARHFIRFSKETLNACQATDPNNEREMKSLCARSNGLNIVSTTKFRPKYQFPTKDVENWKRNEKLCSVEESTREREKKGNERA